ncbi:hypothetical protein MTO96_009582 [Rhipicephalus appendiculatus]
MLIPSRILGSCSPGHSSAKMKPAAHLCRQIRIEPGGRRAPGLGWNVMKGAAPRGNPKGIVSTPCVCAPFCCMAGSSPPAGPLRDPPTLRAGLLLAVTMTSPRSRVRCHGPAVAAKSGRSLTFSFFVTAGVHDRIQEPRGKVSEREINMAADSISFFVFPG